MIPVIAIIGRPNVGKSTLFNQLTKSRDALVADFSGLTRDRKYGEGRLGDRPYIVIDTGGLVGNEENLESLMAGQSWQAIKEADVVLFMVDGRGGLPASDEFLANHLRRIEKKIWLVVNKTDGIDPDVAMSEFYAFGLGDPTPIAASHGRGVHSLIDTVLLDYPKDEETEEESKGIKLAVIGRPNVGKSTLVNRILGEERVVVYDMPGTTRDSIFIPMERHGKHYTLIDTAGVRRRGRVRETVEKFSVIKALQAIEAANVVILLIDGSEGLTDQDMSLLGFILDSGKAMLLGINKWDGLDIDQREFVNKELDRRLNFLDFVRIHFISALHGTGVGGLFKSVEEAYESATKELSTPVLTRILEKAVEQHQPALVRGRRVKLRYAHAGGHNPPRIIIHGNQTEYLQDSYKRYLSGKFRKALKLMGTPVIIETRTSVNPFKGRKNKLTPGQIRKRKRMFRHVKKK